MQIQQNVLVVLSDLRIVQHDTRSIARIDKQLDRKLYLDVNKVLEALGGKWDRKAKGHVFDGDANTRIDTAIITGEVATNADLGHFPTPAYLAGRIVEMADVQEGHWCLEPSAGDGALVGAMLDRGAHVVAIELEPMRAEKLRQQFSGGGWIHCGDFIDWTNQDDMVFDRIVMNPPFCRSGRGDHLDHVSRAFDHLAHGGILIAVMPAGVKFREDRRHRQFRQLVELHDGRIDDLPEDSFKESGTSVRTCVVRMVRR